MSPNDNKQYQSLLRFRRYYLNIQLHIIGVDLR